MISPFHFSQKIGDKLMRILCILIASVIALSSCAALNMKDKNEEAKNKSKIAMDDFNGCTVRSVAELDDEYSDVNSIALALTNYCMIEYMAHVKATGLSANKSDKELSTFATTAFTREAKIKASIDTVLKYRRDKLSSVINKPDVQQ